MRMLWLAVAAGEPACAALKQLQVPGAALSEVTAEWFAAGSPPPPEPPWVAPLAVKLPAYCRLSATLDRRPGADGKSYGIGFALALPAEIPDEARRSLLTRIERPVSAVARESHR